MTLRRRHRATAPSVAVAQRHSVRVSGERVSTPEGGFKPTWERHVAAYKAAAELLPPDGSPVLDVGCGTGHSYHLLAPRETVGVDVAAGALKGQKRRTIVADMRELPLPDASFASFLSVQSIEHVPDPERALAEARRVLEPGGVAIFVTPNRLTFGRPDEIIDPYHDVEYDQHQLRDLCERFFDTVEMRGLFGSERYLRLVDGEKQRLDELLRRDPLRLRRFVPRAARQWLYDTQLSRERAEGSPEAVAIELEDFALRAEPLDEALDLVAVCR
jgi:SAM-dependent methyltransferase